MVLAPWNYEPSACGRFVCHGRWSRKIESVAVGAVAAKSRRFYRVLERSNAPRYLFDPATRGCASHKSRPGLELIKNLSIQEIWSSLYIFCVPEDRARPGSDARIVCWSVIPITRHWFM